MQRCSLISIATMILAMLVCSVASAVTVSLTFDRDTESNPRPACTGVDGGLTDRLCTANGQFIGVDYGSTPQLAVSYDPFDSTLSLQTAGSATSSGAFVGASTNDGLSEVIFTPGPGQEVSLVSFVYFRGSATATAPHFQVVNPSNVVVHDVLRSTSANRQTETVNSPYYSGPIKLRFGSASTGAVVIDDVVVDVRGVAPSVPSLGPIPLGAMAMAIVSFVGWRLRRS